MKKIITAFATLCIASSVSLTAHAAEALDRDYIEAEIWEDMWNGKGDNGLDIIFSTSGLTRITALMIMIGLRSVS